VEKAGFRISEVFQNENLFNVEVRELGDLVTVTGHYRSLVMTKQYVNRAGEAIPSSVARVVATLEKPTPIAVVMVESPGNAINLAQGLNLEFGEPAPVMVQPDDERDRLPDSLVPGDALALVKPELNSELSQSELNKSQSVFTEKMNVVDRGGISNFESIFSGYTEVESHIIVSRMNEESDIVSIMGCSHGRTSIKNGNQVLALGRANRVAESFLYSGIDSKNIYDEGCWDSQYQDDIAPRRGVIVAVRRRDG